MIQTTPLKGPPMGRPITLPTRGGLLKRRPFMSWYFGVRKQIYKLLYAHLIRYLIYY